MCLAKYAVFVDLENCGAKVTTLSSILEKVKRSGYDSLTEEEKKRLFNASQKK